VTPSERPGLVLFAHGSREPRWAEPFEAVAAAVRAGAPHADVALAYLELMAPSLADAVAQLVARGCTRIDVVPLFLGAGGHVRQDLPAQLEALRALHPVLRLRLRPAIGEAPEVLAAMAAAAIRGLDAPGT
jgi:sirohydrochlorin cobaltochelatase